MPFGGSLDGGVIVVFRAAPNQDIENMQIGEYKIVYSTFILDQAKGYAANKRASI